ncbi:MAG: trypsin-like peptidase domain-containing protein [Planctomycetota bacterium]
MEIRPPSHSESTANDAEAANTSGEGRMIEGWDQTPESRPEEPKRKVIYHRIDAATLPIVHVPHESQETTGEHDEVQLVELSESKRGGEFSDDEAPVSERRRKEGRRSDPILHSLVMLSTIFIMLAAARFIVPDVVEEIRYAQRRGQLRAEYEVAGEGLRNVSLDTLSRAYQMVTAAAGPSVVHIDVHRTQKQTAQTQPLEFLGAPSIPISDQGSGVVVDKQGYILTNRHVVVDGREITVTLSDGRQVDAMVVGTDPLTDLAVLKVNADHLIPIPWGDSEHIEVGSPVWAIGSPFGLERTVTFGILSGKHRVVRASDRYQDFMQSDVAVNPGNSGGPLVDSRGTLIGINTAIVGDTYQGVSFSIPSAVARKIYERLRDKGSVERGWLGVSLEKVADHELVGGNHRLRGAKIVAMADERSEAAAAGLRPGDIVTQVDGEDIRDVMHLMQVIGNAMAGTTIRLTVVRENEERIFDIQLGQRPDFPRTR